VSFAESEEAWISIDKVLDNARDDRISAGAVALIVLMCALWGGNFVSIKVSNRGIPPILAAAARSLVASGLLFAYARLKGEKVFFQRADLPHGAALGVLFGLDFLLLYWGVAYTDASRAIIFLYTQPLWLGLGAHLLLPSERLNWTKGAGLSLSFLGLVVVFGSRSSGLKSLHWIGDLMEVGAAVCWAATMVYIKRILTYRQVTHIQTLFAQLFFSIPVLVIGVLVFEWGRPVILGPLILANFVYQSVIVAFLSYLLYLWMIHRYPVTRLTSFTFLAPLFGVLFGGLLLGEMITIVLCVGLALVAAGIYLVNREQSRT
jgi:drug/metabolite transporter (DMT)-like permease